MPNAFYQSYFSHDQISCPKIMTLGDNIDLHGLHFSLCYAKCNRHLKDMSSYFDEGATGILFVSSQGNF
jgi:hypothetical protein